ncbi:MAG: bifunctional non-ous end joining protein LigD [Tepidanaerobacteraceae bacterium]|nr:bifunctional non-ous end joining protein LigD [Tepidanaerobacteraceae bacterium]
MIVLHSPFYPMEPETFPRPFDDSAYGFQIKWDGTRILAHVGDKTELFNRKKAPRTQQYPEIAEYLSSVFKKRSVVLDGEMITLFHGKPCFQRLMRRDRALDPATVKFLMERIPVTYVVFDILFLDGIEFTGIAFQARNDMLKSLIPPADPVVAAETFFATGTALFDVVKQHGLEGIVAKRLDSLYEIGKKSKKWLKIKNKRLIDATIGGYLAEGRKIRSLLLGIFQDEEFTYIGRVGSGLKEAESRALYDFLSKLQVAACPFKNMSSLAAREKPCWVEPKLEVQVEYLDFTDEGYLRHPVIKGIVF